MALEFENTLGYIAPSSGSAPKPYMWGTFVAITFRFGHFELRTAQRALIADGKLLHLGGRAFDILLALVERRDRVVEFDELLDVVWPGLAVEQNNLSVQISSLRKLLGPTAITTVRGKGYRFTAPTQEITSLEASRAPVPLRVPAWQPGGAMLVIQPVYRGSIATQTNGATLDQFLGDLAAEAPGTFRWRIVDRRSDELSVAFERASDASRSALNALRRFMRARRGPRPEAFLRIGIAAADDQASFPDGNSDAALLARALSETSGPNEITVTADSVAEFVVGVDGDVEDLGDLSLVSGMVRAYRLRPATVLDLSASRLELGPDGLRPSIAVLPFDSLVTADPDDMLGEALADGVITCLSGCAELRVISGLSSRRLKRCGLTADNTAVCLASAFLLTGSYRLVAGRISLNVQVQDAHRGTVIHSMHLDAGLQEAFDPIDPLGDRIGREVVQTLFSYALEQSKTRTLLELENYSLLMAAIGLMHRAAPKEFERARAMLDHLATRDGCSGIASAWLAKWHVLRVVQGWSFDASEDSQLALDHVGRSLEEDSRDALALSIGGLVYAYLRKDLSTAGQLYEAAIDANPSEPLAWLFTATRHAYLGEGPQAEAAGEQALRLSPIDPLKYFFDSLAATAALANFNWERSIALSERSIKANRTHASTWRTLAFALVRLNRIDEARVAVQRLLAIEPGFTASRFKERFPGRDGPMAQPWANALMVAGLPA